MFDSDCDGGLVRLDSEPAVQTEWDTAPRDITFKLKVKMESSNGVKTHKYVYTLKTGAVLPYKPTLPGLFFLGNL